MDNIFLHELFKFVKFCVYLLALLVFISIVVGYITTAVCKCIDVYFAAQTSFLDKLGEGDDEIPTPSTTGPISPVRH